MLQITLLAVIAYFGLALLVARGCALNGRLENAMIGPTAPSGSEFPRLPVEPTALDVVAEVEEKVVKERELTVA